MKTIRNNVFETNSSAQHTMIISDFDYNALDDLKPKIKFKIIDFGYDTYDDHYNSIYSYQIYSNTDKKAAYLYELIILSTYEEKFLNIVKNVLNKHDIEYEFDDKNKEKLIDIYKRTYSEDNFNEIDNSDGIGLLVNDNDYYHYEINDFCRIFELGEWDNIDEKYINIDVEKEYSAEELQQVEINIMNWLFDDESYMEHIPA